jgi:integrase
MAKSDEPEAERPHRLRLTDAHVRTLPAGPDGRAIDYSDEKQTGLRLRVSARGRWFIAAFLRPKGEGERKQSCKTTLGAVGSKVLRGDTLVPLTLALAREMVEEVRARVRAGGDPVHEKRAARIQAEAEAAPPVKGKVFADYTAAFAQEEMVSFRLATRTGWQRFLDKEIDPVLGQREPDSITAEDIAELRQTIAAGVKAKDGGSWNRKPAPTSARRCFEVVRCILAWSASADPEDSLARKRHDLPRLPTNPAASAGRRRSRRRKAATGTGQSTAKALTDPEIRAVFRAAEAEAASAATTLREWDERHPDATVQERAESTTVRHAYEARAFQLLMELIAHTGVRAHDGRAAEWKAIDTKRALWTVSLHKTSGLEGVGDHLVPLSEGALDVLRRAREHALAHGYGHSRFVFPAPVACETCGAVGHLGKDAKSALRIRAVAGLGGRGVLHRWRDTLSTRLAEADVDARVREALLAHKVGGVAGIYDAAPLVRQRTEALALWCTLLRGILSGDSNGETGTKQARASRTTA